MRKKRFVYLPIDYHEAIERLEQLAQLAQRESQEENCYPYPITEREQILIRLYSYWELGMTPQRFYQKWDLTREDMALICSCSVQTVNGWFNTSRRCYPPTAGHLRHLAIMDFLLEDFETIPKPLLERLFSKGELSM
ncbi:MAG: hypothetical protein F6J90_03225 [Moorea sp. SIOASIH]|uniref:hypothetical protein n=1 Tax=Moorena sp. SIOASIH TaxID=2607817 RepID=UPI0013BBFDC0|nr:hypothetical protein [Moorena sp. SIOASIH]NEO35369.1 hypothetical protein [Moorena sp. SIOASIH]